MGIVYDENVEESKLYSAYGFTAYGKINRYEWTIFEYKIEECIITLRIVDNAGKDIFNIALGNRCAMMEVFGRTIDNFLYWISAENPDVEQIEKQVFESLCQSNSLFNHKISMRKFRDQRKKEEQKRIEERKKKEQIALDKIKEYCQEKHLIFYYDGWKVYLLKTLCDATTNLINQAIGKKNYTDMKKYIQFAEKYPENRDLHIVQIGVIQEINIEH